MHSCVHHLNVAASNDGASLMTLYTALMIIGFVSNNYNLNYFTACWISCQFQTTD